MKPEFAIFATGIADTKVLYRLIDKLNDILKELYHNKQGTITQKVANIGPSLTAVFNYLEKKGLEPEGDAAQKSYVEEIVKYLRALPQAKLTLAFEPDDTFSNRLNEVVSSLARRKVVLDISVNHHIIAGVTLEYQGKFADYSYESRTNSYLKQKWATFFATPVSKPEKQTVGQTGRGELLN